MENNVIEKLRDDVAYYGEYGSKYLSNSDIYSLIHNPASFKKGEMTLSMLLGRYFHTYMLEPDKLGEFIVVDAATRNNKDYKLAISEVEEEYLMLRREVDEMTALGDKIKANLDLHSIIYSDGNTYESPAIKEIYGEMWKGKADIVTDSHVVDLKTTGDISKFKYSAYTYNYDSQAYLYQELFGKPMMFIVICKKTGVINTYECGPEFIERGRDKVMDAVIQYRKFFGKDKTEDVDNYYTKLIL